MVIKMFVVIYFFDPIKKIKEKRKKYIEKKSKNTRGYTWRKLKRLPKLAVNDQNDKRKVERPKYTILTKLTVQF